MFSSRLPRHLGPNIVSQAVGQARAAGAIRFDLTETNPTTVALPYPEQLASALADADVRLYRPAPFGSLEARAAAASSYEAQVRPEQVVLTASTSEAYSFLFKLLCDAGDEVLVPTPSYPLFELLTGLDHVRSVPYRLDPQGAWCLDRDSIEHARSPRTRAVLVVSPNNPTGSMVRTGDREWLVRFAAEHRLALIADEVFAPYLLTGRPDTTSFVNEGRALTFTLGGLSKSAGLPQMKLAWTVVSGPAPLVADALSRLEIIADTYLSVSTPVQLAAAALIEYGGQVRAAIQQRIVHNLETVRAAVSRAPALTLHLPDGGWSVVVRVPAILTEEQIVLGLLAAHAVLVHPGYFFDVETEAYLVLSLLPPPDVFAGGVERIVRFFAGEMV
jgi:aspartate/methionine/tyrosine aminotransferase